MEPSRLECGDKGEAFSPQEWNQAGLNAEITDAGIGICVSDNCDPLIFVDNGRDAGFLDASADVLPHFRPMTNPDIEYARAGDRAELLDFLFAVFRRDRPDHPRFETLFPDIFFADTDEFMERHAILRVDGRIAACVGMYHLTLRIAGCEVPFAGIGQVSTGAEYLGRGFMTALLRAQLQRARDEGATLAWLGGRHDRYSRFGFETVGVVYQFGFDPHAARAIPRTRSVAPVDIAPGAPLPTPLVALRNVACDSIVETPERYARHLLRPALEIWTATPATADQPDAWVVYNREARVLDEVSGNPEGILEIVAVLAERANAEVCLSVSPASRPLAEACRRACAHVGSRMNNIAVLDPDRLLAAYRPLLPPDTPSLPDNLSSGELARLCFGPERSSFPVQLPFHFPDFFHV